MPGKQDLPVSFDELREKNLEQLKLLNNVVLPVKIPDAVYRDCIKFKDCTQMAYHNDVLVGGVAARCEKQTSGKARLYIASLAVLAPYRNYGIGSKLLSRCLSGVEGDANVEEAAVHVQASNEEAIKFYTQHGFTVAETVPGYYSRLDPPDAVLMVKKLRQ